MSTQGENSLGIRQNTGRNIDGTFKPGVSGNLAGRPKNTLKDYIRNKFMAMSKEQKEDFLKDIPHDIQWRMGEGNPAQDIEQSLEIRLPIPLDEVKKTDALPKNNSIPENKTIE